MDFEYKMEITADPEEVFAALTNPLQEWFFGEQEKQSIVRITLKKEGARTLVGLTHTHIPEDVYEEITGGWKEYYLEAIKGMLEMY